MEGSNISRDTAHIQKFDGRNIHTCKFGLMLLMRNFNLRQIILGEGRLPVEFENKSFELSMPNHNQLHT